MSGLGNFTGSGEEYVVTQPNLIRPLQNYHFGRSILSSVDQVGGGTITVRGSDGRLSELIDEKIGRLIYLRDNDTNDFWSPTWMPTRIMPDFFETHFGLGVTTIRSSAYEVETTLTIRPHPTEPVEVWQLTIANKTKSKKRLSLTTALPWNLGPVAEVETIGNKNVVFAANLRDQLAVVAFFAASEEANDFLCWEDELRSYYESFARPKTIITGRLNKDTAGRLAPLGGFQKNINLADSGSIELTFFVGAIFTTDCQPLSSQKNKLVQQVAKMTTTQLLAPVVSSSQFPIRVSTPEKEFDHYFNNFLQYQNKLAASWPSTRTLTTIEELCQAMAGIFDESVSESLLFRLLALQFKEGNIVHGVTGETGAEKTVTQLSDGLLFIDAIITHLERFADLEILRTTVEYRDSGQGTVLEHLIKSLQNLISQLTANHLLAVDGREDVALSARLVFELKRAVAIMAAKNEEYLVKKYNQLIELISSKIEKSFWLSPWYSRGRDSQGNRIGVTAVAHGWDLAAQLWPIMAAIPNTAKIKTLVSRLAKQTAASGPLNFEGPYLKSVSEDFAISHTTPGQGKNCVVDGWLAPYLIAAAAAAGEGEIAWRVVTQLSANFLASNPGRYQAGPFWQASTIDGPDSTTPGRGHVTLPGPAPLLTSVVLEYIFGLKSTLDGLVVNPCLPKSWRQIEVSYRWRDADLQIRIQNPFRTGSGVNRIMVDGVRLNSPLIKTLKPGTHFIEVILG